MDPDVQSKISKLDGLFIVAQGQLEATRPSRLPTRKSQMRLRTTARDTLGRLQTARKPAGAAMLRLAYVRAMRDVREGARLGSEEEREVVALETRLDEELSALEVSAFTNFWDHLRLLQLGRTAQKMKTSQAFRDMLAATDDYFPLQQRAHTVLRSFADQAAVAGALAATEAASYDGVTDGV